MVTVAQLIKQLSKLDPKAVVILQRDSEGNGFSPLVGAEAAKYRAENKWSGEVPHPDDLEDMDEEDKKGLVDCVVLWPTN